MLNTMSPFWDVDFKIPVGSIWKKGWPQWHFLNGRIRISENLPPVRTMRTLATIVKINFFKTLEIKQRLTMITEVFM